MTKGSVAPGFEAVGAQFERNFRERGEIGAALCVNVDGHEVVNIWDGYSDRSGAKPWQANTIAGIFSGGKGLVAVCLLMLIERGLLELAKPVAHYWPEFAAEGKSDILVLDVVSHRAGLPGLRAPVTAEDATDDIRMAGLLAAQAPECRPGERLYYHALTFGWLCGELVRRIDGRSVGRFFRDEVARPLQLDAWIGLPGEEERRVATLECAADFGARCQGNSGRPVDSKLAWSIYENPPRLAVEPLPANSRHWRAAEIPASNAVASAPAIARLYGCLARGGEIDGIRLLLPRTVKLGHTLISQGIDPFLNRELSFGIGFQLNAKPPSLRPEATAFGHPGAGGSVHGAWQDLRTSFSYIPNLLRDDTCGNPRAEALLEALHSCLANSKLPFGRNKAEIRDG